MFGIRRSLGVDIADDAVRIVALRAAGAGYEIEHVASLPLPENRTMEDVAERLAALANELPAARRLVACGLPGSGCAVKTALLPPARPADLAQVAKFEAETQIPLPFDDLVWGFTATPDLSGQQQAVIVGARRSLVEDRLSLLQLARMAPSCVLPSPLAAAAAIAHPAERHLVVVVGSQWSDLCLFAGDRLLACRSVLTGPATNEGWIARIAREVRPWLAGSDRPAVMLLLGGVTPETAAELGQTIDLPVSTDTAWDRLRDAHGILLHASQPAAYATAIGLAKTALSRQQLNLLPPQISEARRQRCRLAWTLTVLALLVCALIPAVLASGAMLRARRAEYQEVAEQVRLVQRTRPTPLSAGMTLAQHVVDALGQPESQPLDILQIFSTKLPEKVTLTDFSYDRGKAVVIMKGYADTYDTVAAALGALVKMPMVERAVLDYANTVNSDKRTGCDFQLTCRLQAAGDPTFANGRRPGKTAARKETSTP